MWVRLMDIVITGEGMWLVARRQQMCYVITIPGIDGECHIIKHNFQVDVSPTHHPKARVNNNNLHLLHSLLLILTAQTNRNVVSNVFSGDKEIQQLCAERIEVYDNSEPLPDEAVATPQPTVMYSYDKPMFWPCRVDQMSNSEGSWVYYRWDEIAAKSEFKLFRMMMPEQYIHNIVLPATNVFLT
jgi:hypothetical protein